ncbi:hypothetical protein [uncultured Salinicola sp.]|uniref:hypothetical protein n=1 Tax=uncultured Salinicola sp. TaxID=1193542 RepID=UPI002636AC73|nr:hypothetical protein [uncultured Salinicola sp.]
MIDRFGRLLERAGRFLVRRGKAMQNRGYPRVVPIYEDTPRPNRDTPIYPGEF